MNKFKNYGFWTALSGAVVMFLKTLGDACGFSIPQETVSNLIMAVAEILVVLGIVAMPKSSDEVTKDKEQNKQEKDEETFLSDNEEKLNEEQRKEQKTDSKENTEE